MLKDPKQSKPDKTLILCLTKGGSNIYSREISRHFPISQTDLLISSKAKVIYDFENVYKINGFESFYGFLFKSLFVYPFILIFWFFKIVKNYDRLYIPQSGIWDLGFIFIFKLLGKNITYTIHDAKNHKGETFDTSFLIKFGAKMANQIIFLTNNQRLQFEENNILSEQALNEKKIGVFPHGIFDLEGINPKKEYSTKNILFLGRIIKYKGIDLLLEAADNISEKFDKLIIAGESNYDLPSVKTENIEIINKFLSEKEMVDLLNWADLLVLPYLEATQSGIVTLGINSELPIVCTRVGGLVEQLTEDECVFVEPNSIKSLEDGIQAVLSDTNKRRLLQDSLAIKKQKMSWEQISHDIQDFINNEN